MGNGKGKQRMALKYNIVKTSKYKRDCKAAEKSGLDIEKLELVVRLLAADIALPPRNRDHALTGNWRGYRECHIGPDWLLVYAKDEGELELVLVRTGSHSKLQIGG